MAINPRPSTATVVKAAAEIFYNWVIGKEPFCYKQRKEAFKHDYILHLSDYNIQLKVSNSLTNTFFNVYNVIKGR